MTGALSASSSTHTFRPILRRLPSVRVMYDMVAVGGRLTAQLTLSTETKSKSGVELERAAS